MPSHKLEVPNAADKPSRAGIHRDVVCDLPHVLPVTDDEVALLVRVLGDDLVHLLDDGEGD